MERKEIRYLRLIGRLYPDNQLVLRPGYLTDVPRFLPAGGRHPLRAELLDDEGRLLVRAPVPTTPYCTLDRVSSTLGVRADLPFAEGTRRIRFLREDVLVHEIAVPPRGPSLELTWLPPAKVAGKMPVSWHAEHPDQSALEYIIRYSHDDGETWQRIGRRTRETKAMVDVSGLPGGGRCRLAVLATDGVNSTIATSRAFAVPVKSCVALVLAPADGTSLGPGEALTLRGQGFYLEERATELRELTWRSNRAGELGHGRSVTADGLAPGRHLITLTAGQGRRAGSAAITVEVARGGANQQRKRGR